jgi:hypothetical protein
MAEYSCLRLTRKKMMTKNYVSRYRRFVNLRLTLAGCSSADCNWNLRMMTMTMNCCFRMSCLMIHRWGVEQRELL